jgi:hypothetical protein
MLIGICCFAALEPATAADRSDSMFSLSAFGTIGAVHSSEHSADFVDNVFAPNGAGFTRNWSTDIDSRLGAQLTTRFTDKLSAVVQVITQQDYDNTYRPSVEWANIKYQLTSDLDVRAGRTVLPTFLFSDSRQVGYVQPWVRPPIEAYGLVPIDTTDGVDFSYREHWANVTSTFNVGYGSEKSKSSISGSNELRGLLVIANTLEYGPATVHAAYQQGHLYINALNPLFDAFSAFGPQGTALADKYGVSGKPFKFYCVGAMLDPGQWFIMGEWGTNTLQSALGNSTAWYASAGYRLAHLTPYLTYSAVKLDSNRFDPGINVGQLPPFLAPTAAGLNSALNAILGSRPVQHTVSLGLRWDFLTNLDLKVQYDHTRLGADSAGVLTNLQPGFQPGGTVNLWTAVIDFVL